MATVMIKFDGGGVPIVTGDIPPNDQTPLSNPTRTDFTTNKSFTVAEGFHCFGLQSSVPHTPLWQVVQAIDDVPAEITFKRVP